jgi:hypothetical protein
MRRRVVRAVSSIGSMSEYQAGYEAGAADAELDRIGIRAWRPAEYRRGYADAWEDAGKPLDAE